MTKLLLRSILMIASAVLYFITVVAAYGGWFDPRLIGFPALLGLAYPFLAIATVIVGLVWLCFRKKWIALGAAATIFMSWGTFHVAVMPCGHSSKPAPREQTFTFMTFNTFGATDVRQPSYAGNRTLEFILKESPDIACLQELYGVGQTAIQHGWREQYADSIAAMYPYANYDQKNALTILSKYPMTLIKGDMEHEYLGHYDIYRVEIGEKVLHIINVHMVSYGLTEEERNVVTELRNPGKVRESIDDMKLSIMGKMKTANAHRAANALDVAAEVGKLPKPLILCGDFNDVPGSWTYRTIKKDGLTDAYVATNFFSLPTYNLHAFYFHIDQIFCSEGLRPLNVRINRFNASDHYPLLAEFAFTTTTDNN